MSKSIKEHIVYAIDKNDTLMMENLIIRGANLNVALIDSLTPLGLAIIQRKKEMVKLLLKQPSLDVNLEGAFFYALRHQAHHIIPLMMEHPSFNMETQNSDGESYLYQACFFSLQSVAIELIEKGARWDIENKFNDSVLDICQERNLLEVIQLIHAKEEMKVLKYHLNEAQPTIKKVKI